MESERLSEKEKKRGENMVLFVCGFVSVQLENDVGRETRHGKGNSANGIRKQETECTGQ